MRKLGVHGKNNPTKRTKNIVPSNFLIGGLIIQSERKYDKAFEISDMSIFREIFGNPINSAWYGYDTLNGFFQNIAGIPGKLWVKSYVGNTGSAIDAVVASKTINDTTNPTIKGEAAYKGDLEYGISGNRTGYTITNGFRFSTALDGATGASDEFIILDSVIGIKIGDVIKIVDGTPIYRKVTGIDENLRKVSFTGAVGSIIADNTVVGVMGLRLRTWRKDINGMVKEVEEELGRIYVTLEPEVTDYYINVVHSNNKWIKWTDLASATSGVQNTYPADVTTVTYLENGADGTVASDTTLVYRNFAAFDGKPVRFLGCPETVSSVINKYGETYCKGRWDNPKWLYNISENLTKAQLITTGHSYQRSDDVLGVICANWLGISDVYATGSGVDRHVPNIGFVMGAWMRSIYNNGIHFIPAVRNIPLYGVNSVIGDQLTDDQDRTDVAEAGINMIQEIEGYGVIIRNFFTPSTDLAFLFANGILMREFIKISSVDSLQDSENTPNSMARVRQDANAIYLFMLNLWDKGSTGNVSEGETFGISENEDGSTTSFEDHVEVKADIINNPQSQLNAGERNIDVAFTYPSPAGSIEIGVGILLR